MSNEFVNTQIDTENQNTENFHENVQLDEEDDENKKLKSVIRGKDIIQLKSNYIPKGLIPLEKLFDQNDVAEFPKVQPIENYIEDQNIGIENVPRIVKLSKNLPVAEKEKCIHLMNI